MSSEDKDWPKRKYANEQERKCHKPILEKKRRARINKSLDQLKMLLLETVKGDGGHYSKLEKADILEMTVKHLKDLQRQQLQVAMVMDPGVVQRYETGFSECATEVNRYLTTIDGIDHVTKSRLVDHLGNCRNNVSNATMHQPQQQPTGLGLPVVGQMATIQQYSVVGPISPPLYGQIFEVQNQQQHHPQSSRMSDVSYGSFSPNSSIMYPSTSHTVNTSGVGKRKPEATVTRQSLNLPTLGPTRGLSDSTNTHIMQRQQQPNNNKTLVQNIGIDKENITSMVTKKESKPQRQFTGQNISQNQMNITLNTQNISNANYSSNNHHNVQNDNQKVGSSPSNGQHSNFSQSVRDEPMWRPW